MAEYELKFLIQHIPETPRHLNRIFTPLDRLYTRRIAAGLKPLAQYMEALRADERVRLSGPPRTEAGL